MKRCDGQKTFWLTDRLAACARRQKDEEDPVAGELNVNFPQIAAASQAWTDMGDEADRVGKNLTNGVPDLMAAFGNDVYARKVVPNLQPAVDGSVTLITSVTSQCYSTGTNLAITGQEFAKADNTNKDLVPPPPTPQPQANP